MIETLSIGNIIGLLFLLIFIIYISSLLIQQLRTARQIESLHQHEIRILQAHFDCLKDEREYKKQQHKDAWVGLRKFTVKKKIAETSDVYSFYFEPHDGRPLPSFKPGQYLTFSLRIPEQAKPVIRCYSLSSSPYYSDFYRCSIKRMLAPRNTPDAPQGLSSNFFHDHINEGDIVDVRAPSGHFFLDMTRNFPIVLIAGGIGLTPVLSMLNAVVELEEQRPSMMKREVWFFYGMMNSDDHAFKEHLINIAKQHSNIHMQFCYTSPNDSDVLGQDYHHKGFVSVDLFKQLLPSNNYDFYTCGPPPMMNAINDGLSQWGVPKANIHYETFGSNNTQKTVSTGTEKPSTTIEVNFAKSGKTVRWADENLSILDLAEANDVAMDFGCRAGNCGSCQTAIRSGKVRYTSEPDASIEQGSCLPCVSVPNGNIIIDA